jgi:hypothetical protein
MLQTEREVEARARWADAVIAKCVKAMPTQAQYIAEHCAAGVA